MVLSSKDIILISKDDVRKLLKGIYIYWKPETINKLNEIGALQIINELKKIIKEDNE